MKRQQLWTYMAIIGAVTLLLLANIVPWRQLSDGFQASDLLDTLRPGIDLAGGTRLIYQVNTENWTGSAGESPAQSMIRALKPRVDPAGAKNIIWRPVGEDRIEIIIPRATASSTQKRKSYEQTRDAVLQANIRTSDIEKARSASTPDARRAAFGELERSIEGRKTLLNDLANAAEKLIAAEKAPGTTQPSADPAVLDARAQYDAAAKAVLDTNLRWLDVYHVLRMGKERSKSPKSDDSSEEKPTPLETLRQQYPSWNSQIDKLVAAFDGWRKEKESLDDPNDLKRLLQGTGVLEFHIAVQPDEVGNPQTYIDNLQRTLDVPGGRYAWFEAFDPHVASHSGVVAGMRLATPYVLVHITPEKSMVHTKTDDWKFKSAYRTSDEWGSPAVGFEFDELGGNKFAQLTGRNVKKPLTAILDGKVISIANILQKISDRGQITGSFSPEEVAELSQKLQAGALPGSLSKEPISESQVGAQLGEAHRKAGLTAASYAVVGVFVFMLGYYLVPLGLVACIAVILDIIGILGLMAAGQVLPGPGFTFTLPGIAGFALTIGMAVDANVLIDERIREEQDRGVSLRVAVKNGYSKALSAIMDSNITTLITTVILYALGTPEIKGFAITLGLGVVVSMITAVFVTRVLLQLGIEYGRIKGPVKMLRLIRVPNIRWMDKRYLLWGISATLIVGGLLAFFLRTPSELYDVEFIGGTKAQFTLAPGIDVTDGQIEAVIRLRSPLKDAAVHSVMESGGGNRKTFEMTTNNTDQNVVKQALAEALTKPANVAGVGSGNLLRQQAVLKFAEQSRWSELAGASRLTNLPPGVFALTDQAIASPDLAGHDLTDYVGGVGLIVSGLDPASALEDLRIRIRGRLTSDQFQTLPSTGWEVFGLDKAGESGGQPTYRKVLYVVRSDQFAFDPSPAGDNQAWANSLVLPETQMIQTALSQSDVLDSINNFSPSVAKDVKIQALVAMFLSLLAVVIYVWVRFGNVLFGIGSIVPLFHDVCVVVGLVAISKFLAGTPVGRVLLIQDFRFDLTVVAALLTIIGYSLNDTIVVFDRIRENRGRLPYVTAKIIDDSINQTMSRTLLTGLTTIAAVFIMYVLGGPGIHAFSFAMLIGLVVGTYSSIAIGAPILLGGRLLKKIARGEAAAARPA